MVFRVIGEFDDECLGEKVDLAIDALFKLPGTTIMNVLLMTAER
jgi:hypothetical protein